MIKFRYLRAEEVECRVAMVKDNGLQLLLYKTARTDGAILDETVGAENWQCDYKSIDGKLFCGIGIRVGDEWVWKWDTGTPSNMEAQKGEASDARKRAGFAWSIGTELYFSPFIWIPKQGDNYKDKYERFDVKEFEVTDGRVTGLVIVNSSGKIVYAMGNAKPAAKPKKAVPIKIADEEERTYKCSVCGGPVDKSMAEKSINKYGKVYCCKACFDRRPIE